MQHYLVHYSVQDGTRYEQKSVKASTIVGVAEVVARLYKDGTPAHRWEKVTIGRPAKAEQDALEAYLRLAEVPVPHV